MRAKKEDVVRLRPAAHEEEAIIAKFLRLVGVAVNPFKGGIYILDIEGARYRDAFYLPVKLRSLVGRGVAAYSGGLYLGSIEDRRLKPGLPLARALKPLCSVAAKCVKLTPRGEQLFLYGRTVEGYNIVGWKPGYVIVLAPDGEAIGWGYGDMRRAGDPSRNLILKPLKDLGWYLRRGG